MNQNLSLYPLTLYYDGACPLCMAEMRNLMLRNTAGRLRFVDMAPAGFVAPAGAKREDLARLLHGQAADGRWLRGVDTFVAMYEAVGVPWVAQALGGRWVRPLAERGYPWLARNRHRIPRWLAHVVFGTALRRAARQVAAAGECAQGACRRDGS